MKIHKILISYVKLDHTLYSINYGTCTTDLVIGRRHHPTWPRAFVHPGAPGETEIHTEPLSVISSCQWWGQGLSDGTQCGPSAGGPLSHHQPLHCTVHQCRWVGERCIVRMWVGVMEFSSRCTLELTIWSASPRNGILCSCFIPGPMGT